MRPVEDLAARRDSQVGGQIRIRTGKQALQHDLELRCRSIRWQAVPGMPGSWLPGPSPNIRMLRGVDGFTEDTSKAGGSRGRAFGASTGLEAYRTFITNNV
jgi:hypothetical protein